MPLELWRRHRRGNIRCSCAILSACSIRCSWANHRRNNLELEAARSLDWKYVKLNPWHKADLPWQSLPKDQLPSLGVSQKAELAGPRPYPSCVRRSGRNSPILYHRSSKPYANPITSQFMTAMCATANATMTLSAPVTHCKKNPNQTQHLDTFRILS